MAENIVELIAGAGISLTASESLNSITINNTGMPSVPLPLDKGGTGRTDLTAEDIEKLKRMDEKISEYIKILAKPILITQSGQFNIPVTGKWEIRLCGGGASGAGGYLASSSSHTSLFTGAGGNGGYLITKEMVLNEGTPLSIIIGAGGVYNNVTKKASPGANTKITINGGEVLEAKGGDASKSTVAATPSIAAIPTIPYDGFKGSTKGGNGGHHQWSSGGTSSNPTTAGGNGASGAAPGGTTSGAGAGGGGGGTIAGNISAGRGQASSSALGYGAGGGGGEGQSTEAGGNGAQGVVRLEYIGPA